MSEGREGMPGRHGTGERIERSEGRAGMPSRHGMSVDELRAGLARIAGTVVPDADPYALVLRHARRRRRNRWAGAGSLLAALLAATLAGPAIGIGGLHTWLDDPHGGTGHPLTSDWSRRLLDSPTRGSLADDRPLVDELTRVFDRDRDEAGMSGSLPTVKVLFADDSVGVRVVVVAYRSDTSAGLVAKTAPVGSGPREMVRAGGLVNLPVSPFTVLDDSLGDVRWQLGLAPAGCLVSSAPVATVAPDGRVRRSWMPAPMPGYRLLTESSVQGWWRVECDGTVREQGPAALRDGELSSKLPGPARSIAGPPTTDEVWQAEQAAVRDHLLLTAAAGLPTDPAPVRRWNGRIPGEELPASIVGPASGVGPVVLHVGAGRDTLLAMAPEASARPDDDETRAAGRADWALAATAVTSSRYLTAVRLPARSGGHAVLTDRLLVVPASADAAQVELVGPQSSRTVVPVANGVAVVTVPPGSGTSTIQVLNTRGEVLVIQGVNDFTFSEQIFDEPLISDWG